MRALTSEEIERIAGGYGNEMGPPTPLSPVIVTASNLQAFDDAYPIYMARFGDWLFNQGFEVALAAPGSGSTGNSESTAEQEFENGAKAAIELAENGVLGSDIAHELFTSTDYAEMAADINSTQFQYGVNAYNSFESHGNNSFEVPGYDEIIHWDRINWHAYDEDGSATAQEAIGNLFHDIDVNHHVALTATSTWSS